MGLTDFIFKLNWFKPEKSSMMSRHCCRSKRPLSIFSNNFPTTLLLVHATMIILYPSKHDNNLQCRIQIRISRVFQIVFPATLSILREII